MLRSFAGGYHSDTENTCYIFSVCMINIDMLLGSWFQWEWKALFLLVLLCGSVIWFLSPVENDRNPLAQEERRRFRKYSRIAVAATAGCLMCIYKANSMEAAWGIVCSLANTAVLQIMGEVKYGRKTNEYDKLF